ncbi:MULTISPECIES: 4-hydroxy-tetrahydrodipicolinate synthase [unclassified Rhodococcus (in: high G+C Gram-positive bacteria)]|uniref:4-hydroxy-tetrahydrodipicolinate synthase n=1 Tax=unclassified Rhodococcus (in: high G+C Gram-positive bacteria) TaxID=192944 RepID=UPI001FF8CC2F|nr:MULTISPECIES: 4-hydroxy-tetrahydrodipicolinate synthase [unclassified Rhodococcus (in: high G+C Gram-positive bacteria)]
MTIPFQPAERFFGTNLVAMATPMNPDGSLSASGTDALVDHLLSTGCDGLVVAGTTGESPTLTESESVALVQAVSARASGRGRVIAGVGTYDTAATIRRARDAERAGADALLVVCPYYSHPTQVGVLAHCLAVADSTELPVMVYDVPARTGMAIDAATLIEMSAHPRILAVKDAKGDLFEAMSVMESTSLAYYCGLDELNLAYLACGATGLLSVIGNVAAAHTGRLIAAVRAGELDSARTIQRSLIGLTEAMLCSGQGAVMAKSALVHLGVIGHATVRLPLTDPPVVDVQRLVDALTIAGWPAVSARPSGQSRRVRNTGH